MQERLFSPRTLNFGSCIAWECKRGIRSENEPTLVELSHPIKTLFDNFNSLDIDKREDRILCCWNDKVVPLYTASVLTRTSDRLIAIGATVQRLSSQTGWRNIHGLWEPYLIHQLAWYRIPTFDESGNKEVGQQRRNGLAPSWSWASLDAPVKYCVWWKDCYAIAELRQNGPTSNTEGVGGNARSAYLTIKGHLLQLKPGERYKS